MSALIWLTDLVLKIIPRRDLLWPGHITKFLEWGHSREDMPATFMYRRFEATSRFRWTAIFDYIGGELSRGLIRADKAQMYAWS